MIKKQMIFDGDVRKAQLEAGLAVYKAVGGSYSPRGRLTSIGRPWGFPIIIADGVNIAKEVGSEDVFVGMAIDTLIEAAKKQVEEAGDGTTVTTILAYHLLEKGTKLLEKNVNPAVIRKELRDALPYVLDELKKLSTPIKDREGIHRVARISSTDDEIADVVTEAVDKIGPDGQITVEENKAPVMEIEYNEGMQISKGMATPYFVTDIDRMETVLEDVAVCVINKRLTSQLDIVPLLEALVIKSKNILIVGEVEAEALRVCVTNKVKGVLNIVTVPPPASGEKRKELLEDIAAVCGATIVVDELGLPRDAFAKQFKAEWIGDAKTVVSGKNSTLIVRTEIGDSENQELKKKLADRNKNVEEIIEMVRKKRDNTTNQFEKERYEERLAKLTTGVATIKVGSKANVDMRERVERVKDAIAAAKSSQEEGIVPGGGISFTQIAKGLDDAELKLGTTKGIELLRAVLQEPTIKLLENAGQSKEGIADILRQIKNKGGNYGYNVETEKMEDLIKTGVIDPTKVIRLALENSTAVATSMLLTNTMIADVPEKNNMQMA